MRSAQVLTVFALLATSVSSMSIGHVPNQPAHRRHAAGVARDSVLQARAARKPVVDVSDMAERSESEPRRVGRRGINQRRCAPKSTSSALPSSTSAPAVNVEATHSTSTREPETTSQAQSTTSSSKAKYTKTLAVTVDIPATTTKASATTTKATKTSTSAQATSTSDSGSGSSSGSTNTGEGTYYATGLGACGITNVDTDYICAVSQSLFDGFEGYTGSDPNSNPICGKKIKATYQGKSVTVTVTDRCVGCAYNDLDFSPSAFDQLADESVGRLTGMTWVWV